MSIAGAVKSSIGAGLLVLVAVEDADTREDIEWLAGKLVRLRIFNDDAGLMNRSVQEVGGEILVVSQFTLFASTKKGNRPSYLRSAKPEVAVPLYEQFLARLATELGRPIHTGEFRAEVGSSKSITLGSMHSDRAMATRCCWPPESWPGYLAACSGMRTRSR